jgi:hypothetical protein
MVVNNDAGTLDERSALGFFAGKPAPTGEGLPSRKALESPNTCRETFLSTSSAF